MSAGEDVKKRKPFCNVGGTINWCSHGGKQYGGSSKKKIKTELSHNPAIPLLCIYPMEMKSIS